MKRIQTVVAILFIGLTLFPFRVPRAFAAPTRPLLTIPGDQTVVNMRKPLFEWQSSGSGVTCTLQLRHNSKWGALVDNIQTVSNTGNRWPKILPTGKYFWRVKACDETGCSRWSKGFKFLLNKS